MNHRKSWSTAVAPWVCLASAIVIGAGCADQLGCDFEPLANVAYDTTLSVAPLADSVLVYIGADSHFGQYQDMKVYFDAEPAADSDIRFGLHVVGLAANEGTRAVVAHRWSGDTLRVWCGLNEPWTWNNSADTEKCSPDMPWLAPSRVDIAFPAGTNVHYSGRWYPGY